MTDYATAEEIGRRLRLRPSTIRKWALDGVIPSLRLSSKTLRFQAEEVEKALRQRAQEGAAGEVST